MSVKGSGRGKGKEAKERSGGGGKSITEGGYSWKGRSVGMEANVRKPATGSAGGVSAPKR